MRTNTIIRTGDGWWMRHWPNAARAARSAVVCVTVVVAALWIGSARASAAEPDAPAAGALVNPSFEQGDVGGVPAGWMVLPPGYTVAIERDGAKDGTACVRLNPGAASQDGRFGNLMQAIDATPFRGKRVVFEAWVKTEDGDTPAGSGKASPGVARAQLWFRVDRPNNAMGFFDNMDDRPISSAEWRRYRIVGDVASDAEAIALGAFVIGNTRAWVDGASLAVAGVAGEGDLPPRALDESGLENLKAFALVYRAVRWFHPSDEARAADWDKVAVQGVRHVEDAKTNDELARRLNEIFLPLAPTMKLWTTAEKTPAPELDPMPEGATETVKAINQGLPSPAAARMGRLYRQELARTPVAEADMRVGGPNIYGPVTLGGNGVDLLMPLAVYANEKGTLPRARVAPLAADARPEAWSASGNDRAVRLANVIIVWASLDTFYPYAEQMNSPAASPYTEALPAALTKAAIDKDEFEFHITLRRFAAAIHDGHADVIFTKPRLRYSLPMMCELLGERLVVTGVLASARAREGAIPMLGDEVLAIDGKPVTELLKTARGVISYATEGWFRYRAQTEVLRRRNVEPVAVRVKRFLGGEEQSVSLEPVTVMDASTLSERRPEQVAEVAPGVVYFDLNGADSAALNDALPKMAEAKAVIFDMRGYPGDAGFQLMGRLTGEGITSAQWHVPKVTAPMAGGASATFTRLPGWILPPAQPHITGKRVFITDGRAISYAESCMGIIEAYKLGEIVGEPTAGTNGNVNIIDLMGGYSIPFTGMKVLKHDGSRHHGVGILPTVPMTRTIEGIGAGRDELLEKAIEVATAPR